MSLPSTEHYEVVVTNDPEHVGTQCYGVSNRETKVIEYYDNLLPRTFHAMNGIEDKYKEMMDAREGRAPLQLVLPDTDATSGNTEH